MSKQFRNWLRTLGAPEDPVATDTTSEWSAMSLLKGIFKAASEGTIGAAVTGRAEAFVALCQGAVNQCAQYVRAARASKLAAQAAAVSTAADVITTNTNASTSVQQAGLAMAASGIVAGNAMLGQRAKRASISAAASAAAAAASAASVPTVEQSVLGIQIYS